MATQENQTQQGDAESSQIHHNPDLSSLAQMVQMMLEDRRQRKAEIAEDRRQREAENRQFEAEMAEDRRRQERDAEKCIRGMREQIDMLQQLVVERPATTPHHSSDQEGMRLNRLSDIEAYLLTFEQMMQAYEVDRARWTFKLAPQLTDKAQQAYAALSADDANDYDALKTAILWRYNINEEKYRRQFHAVKLKKGETPQELVTRLTDLTKKWGKDCKTQEEHFALMVKEQLLNCLPEDVSPRTEAQGQRQGRRTSRGLPAGQGNIGG